jgi:hypothetical protein
MMAGPPLEGQSPPERIWKVNFIPGFSPSGVREIAGSGSPFSRIKLTSPDHFVKMSRLKARDSPHFDTRRRIK